MTGLPMIRCHRSGNAAEWAGTRRGRLQAGLTRYLFLVTFLMAGFMFFRPAQAAEFRAEASVDRNTVGVGERLVLTIEIYGGGQVTEPDLGDMEGFTLVNTSRSQTLSIVNFDAVRSLTLQYVLVALAEGEYVMGPFKVQSGKESYETDPIKVTVVKGQPPPPAAAAGQPGSGDDAVLVRASVDKSRVYVGEQITYNLQFAYRVTPRDIQYTPPEHTGFWTEDIGETGPAIETIGGKRYYVVNKRSAFFPISAGTFTIGQASVRYTISEFRPFSFDPFDMTRGREGAGVTEPIQVVVRPLPVQGRPAGFAGAVGDFSLRVKPSSREVKTGESMTLSVVISGRGNLKSIGDIDVPPLEGFRVFAPKARESSDVAQSQMGGEKTFDLVLVPERPGEQVIEGLEFSYFDPEREEYVTRRSEPITVNVLPGDETASAPTPGGKPEATFARQDIRYIKRAGIERDGLTLSGGGVGGTALRYLPILVGITGLIVSLGRRRAAVSGKGALNKAYKAALKELKAAREMAAGGGGVAEASGRAARALQAYLAAGTGTSEAVIDQHTVTSMATVGDDTKVGLVDLLAALDRIRFAPMGAGATDVLGLIDRAQTLLGKVNTGWTR
jgi:hypothetical protein